jgi:hypothetical protein
MIECVVKIEGTFSPKLTREYEEFTANLLSFSISIEKEMVIAFPHEGIQLQICETVYGIQMVEVSL